MLNEALSKGICEEWKFKDLSLKLGTKVHRVANVEPNSFRPFFANTILALVCLLR